MKKLIFILCLSFLPKLVSAAWVESFNQASSCYTITSEGPIQILSTPPGTVFLGVNVASTSSTGTLKIYDSSGLASNQFANVNLGNTGFYRFEVLLSSGLTYTTTNNTSGFTIIYKKTRAQ